MEEAGEWYILPSLLKGGSRWEPVEERHILCVKSSRGTGAAAGTRDGYWPTWSLHQLWRSLMWFIHLDAAGSFGCCLKFLKHPDSRKASLTCLSKFFQRCCKSPWPTSSSLKHSEAFLSWWNYIYVLWARNKWVNSRRLSHSVSVKILIGNRWDNWKAFSKGSVYRGMREFKGDQEWITTG